MRCSFLVRAVVVASAILLSRSAAGHGFHAAFSIIDADPKTGALHVTHRMFTQDVDTLIKARSNAAVTVRSGAAFERAIESYIRATFSLRDKAGATLPLTLRFQQAGEVTVQVAVQAAGAGGMPAMGGAHGHAH